MADTEYVSVAEENIQTAVAYLPYMLWLKLVTLLAAYCCIEILAERSYQWTDHPPLEYSKSAH